MKFSWEKFKRNKYLVLIALAPFILSTGVIVYDKTSLGISINAIEAGFEAANDTYSSDERYFYSTEGYDSSRIEQGNLQYPVYSYSKDNFYLHSSKVTFINQFNGRMSTLIESDDSQKNPDNSN
jgi:hypothetical protein